MKQIPSDRETFTEADLMKLPELHPPAAMPNGNVGTPTSIFMEAIRQCKLPPAVIKKLGLKFPKTRVKNRYGNVPFNYGGKIEEPENSESVEETVLSGSGHKLVSDGDYEEKTDDSDLHNQNIHKRLTKKDPETKRRMELNIEENMIHKEDNDSEHVSTFIPEAKKNQSFNNKNIVIIVQCFYIPFIKIA